MHLSIVSLMLAVLMFCSANLVFAQETVIIEGTLWDRVPGHELVAEPVTITLSTGETLTTTTSVTGTWSFSIAAEEEQVELRACEEEELISIPQNRRLELTCYPDKPVGISGVIIGSTGQPLEGVPVDAFVRYEEPYREKTYTDQEGRWTMSFQVNQRTYFPVILYICGKHYGVLVNPKTEKMTVTIHCKEENPETFRVFLVLVTRK